jgi:hypothetical protein
LGDTCFPHLLDHLAVRTHERAVLFDYVPADPRLLGCTPRQVDCRNGQHNGGNGQNHRTYSGSNLRDNRPVHDGIVLALFETPLVFLYGASAP